MMLDANLISRVCLQHQLETLPQCTINHLGTFVQSVDEIARNWVVEIGVFTCLTLMEAFGTRGMGALLSASIKALTEESYVTGTLMLL